MPEIETATFDDLEDIKSLLDSAEVPSDNIDPDFTTYLIARDDSNKIIACIGLELFTGTALLTSFAVDPGHRGNGLGTNLVDRLLEEAFKAGSETVYLCTAKAPKLFRYMGFVGIDLDDVPDEIRRSSLFKSNCPFVAAYMKKRTF
ncbi:MAG: GNAT family N-acetyltransferase [Candidatus Thorarchaeota archaeon]|jgi:N-acetylglutamate synthase-like GNAT family acetyltransferase